MPVPGVAGLVTVRAITLLVGMITTAFMGNMIGHVQNGLVPFTENFSLKALFIPCFTVSPRTINIQEPKMSVDEFGGAFTNVTVTVSDVTDYSEKFNASTRLTIIAGDSGEDLVVWKSSTSNTTFVYLDPNLSTNLDDVPSTDPETLDSGSSLPDEVDEVANVDQVQGDKFRKFLTTLLNAILSFVTGLLNFVQTFGPAWLPAAETAWFLFGERLAYYLAYQSPNRNSSATVTTFSELQLQLQQAQTESEKYWIEWEAAKNRLAIITAELEISQGEAEKMASLVDEQTEKANKFQRIITETRKELETSRGTHEKEERLDSANRRLEEAQANADKKIGELNIHIKQMNNELQVAQDIIAQLETEKDAVDSSIRELEQEKRLLQAGAKQHEAETAALKKEIGKEADRARSWQHQNKALQTELAKSKAAQKDLADQVEKMSHWQTDLKIAQDDLAKLQAAYSAADQDNTTQYEEKIQAKDLEIKNLKTELGDVEKCLSDTREGMVDGLHSLYKDLDRDKEYWRRKSNQETDEIKRLRAAVDLLRADKTELEDETAAAKEAERKAKENLAATKSLLAAAENVVLEQRQVLGARDKVSSTSPTTSSAPQARSQQNVAAPRQARPVPPLLPHHKSYKVAERQAGSANKKSAAQISFERQQASWKAPGPDDVPRDYIGFKSDWEEEQRAIEQQKSAASTMNSSQQASPEREDANLGPKDSLGFNGDLEKDRKA